VPVDYSFETVGSFGEILTRARADVSATSGYLLNFDLRVEFDGILLQTPQLLDAAQFANQYQNPVRPPELYFSHAEFYGDAGIEYIKTELQQKPDSNRAVLSLISTKDIVGKGDDPIPSFLVLQFALAEQYLYVTAYFRALEVEQFLPVNLEEVRLIASQLRRRGLSFSRVRLAIFAFRAYANAAQGVLVRPQLDIEAEESWKISDLMTQPVSVMIDMLREKQTHATAVDLRPFETMLVILRRAPEYLSPAYRLPAAAKLMKACVAAGAHLQERRRASSHSGDLKSVAEAYNAAIGDLIRYLELAAAEGDT
jgi:hypothetical protein